MACFSVQSCQVCCRLANMQSASVPSLTHGLTQLQRQSRSTLQTKMRLLQTAAWQAGETLSISELSPRVSTVYVPRIIFSVRSFPLMILFYEDITIRCQFSDPYFSPQSSLVQLIIWKHYRSPGNRIFTPMFTAPLAKSLMQK